MTRADHDHPHEHAALAAPPNELDRRELLQLLAAGASLAGLGSLAGCMEPPKERIVPRVEQPPELVPGVPLSYATSMAIDGYATGLVVETHEARPTKIDGNPEHPASLGATGAYHQASILDLYDPRRARSALQAGIPIDLARTLRELARREPIAGLWFLLHPQSSPVVAELLDRVRARHPGARFAFHSPLERRSVYHGARLAFGRPLEPQYRFAAAEIVVSLDADFTAATPNSVRWARDFALARRLASPAGSMSRLYLAEPRPSATGSLADHHLPVRASEVYGLARALHRAVTGAPRSADASASREQRWIAAAAADLLGHRGRALVVAGDRQPAEVHAFVHLINAAIGAQGRTIAFTQPILVDPLGDDLAALSAAMREGSVRALVIVEANPIYSAPVALDFARSLARVPETWCVSTHRHETGRACQTFVPLAHYLESWGDARAYDGTLSLVQPLIRPLHDSVMLPALLAAFAGDEHPDPHRLVREHYAGREDGGLLAWQRTLQRGFVVGSAFPALDVAPRLGADDIVAAPVHAPFEICFDRSHATYDGRFAGNAWLQELPTPHEKITWGNAAIISPATARELGVQTEDVVRLASGAWRVELPVYVLPGHADRCATVELGYGRTAGGPIAEGVGANAYPMRTAAHAAAATIAATGERAALARTQLVFDQHDREIALHAELARYRSNPDFTARHRAPLPTLLPVIPSGAPPATGRGPTDGAAQWAMTIDTSICTGCSACVIACQAENNIPVVGKRGVIDNREMHWLRIDTYREQRDDSVETVHQPMMCQHCEHAPCEYVCPTYATQHSPDGLNEMIYNRCIGTRFCSNNCPYKVRRFNWFDYTEDTPAIEQLQRNPNVTVRARGVMEKCTYCVQRIRTAEIAARKERREIRPGEVVTACQQACPTGAIAFGSLAHARTQVVEWRRQPRRYAVLHHLGTRPRTEYLAKITNPSEELSRR